MPDQAFQLKVAARRQDIENEIEMSANPGPAYSPLGKQHIVPKWCIEFQQPILLEQSSLHRPRDILHTHLTPFFLLFH
ncbi:hypothetical protein WK93_10010 [Burkholderia ubonensis]|nr:hypothetical protein WK93_10010 [Burkholderia ubonensis]